MIISSIKIEKHPELSYLLGILIDLLLVLASIRIAAAKPLFYAVNAVGSFALCLICDRAVRHMLRSGDERIVAIAKATRAQGTTQDQLDVYMSGRITLDDWLSFAKMSVGWFAYTIWYMIFFAFAFIAQLVQRLRDKND